MYFTNRLLFFYVYFVVVKLILQDCVAVEEKLGILRHEVEQEKEILGEVERSCQEVIQGRQVVEEEAQWITGQLQATTATTANIQAQVGLFRPDFTVGNCCLFGLKHVQAAVLQTIQLVIFVLPFHTFIVLTLHILLRVEQQDQVK